MVSPLLGSFSISFFALWLLFVLPPLQTGSPPSKSVLRSADDAIVRQAQEPEETTLYFPDYVDGGGWSVQLVISNVAPDAAAAARVEIYDPDGQPVRDLFDSDLTLEIPALGSRILRSAGSGPVRRGWIQVESDADTVNGLLIYRHAQSGIEVGVKPVELGSQFALFVEESPSVGAGVVVFKPDSAPRLELRIRDEEGNDPLEGGFVPWGDFQQAARTLPEWFAVQGVDTEFLGDLRGLLFMETEDESSFAPLGLRFGKRTSSLSAVPAIRIQSEEPQEMPLIFPDYVDGGDWSVQLVLTNINTTAATPAVVAVYDAAGQPVLDLFDSDLKLEIPALGSRVLRSAGSGAIRRGWIQVESESSSVGGLLTYRHAESGIEVGVEPAQLGQEFALFVEESETIGAGLALFKPEASSEIEFQFRDEEGKDPIGEVLTRGNFHQRAWTLPEWLEGTDPQILKGFCGLLFLRAADGSPFAPVGLRFGKRTSSLSAVPVTALDSTQEIAVIVPTISSLGPVEAGKQAEDLIIVTVEDDSGEPVSEATYRWGTDKKSGWVYPSEGITGTDGRISATWVAGSPGNGSLTLTVENDVSAQTVEIPTQSVTSRRPPWAQNVVWMYSALSTGYSIDLTPLTEPRGTYYAAIGWEGGYAGLQRGGFRFDRELQFSVWDVDGIKAQVIRRGDGLICRRFGNEGTGQSCDLNYPWRVDGTYRFEVTEEELNGGSVMTLHVTDLAANRRRFVGALRYGRRANLTWAYMFVEDFLRTAPTCLAQPVRSAAIRRALARIGDSWQPITRGTLAPQKDSGNPGTPPCANLAARDHAAGLEIVMGGRTAGGPLTSREVLIPLGEPRPRGR
ncbi:MAG: DUF3472 domain-containing protein [Acidobacteriota bacterium]|nr:DUF3472 domain-containing protein [Acidobacteriota bacterium]